IVKRFGSVLCVSLAGLGAHGAVAAAATPPGVATGRATGIAQQVATLNGTVNPHAIPTAFYFQYGGTTAYGNRTPTADAGNGTKAAPVSAVVTGLQPHTVYHFRLVAFSTAGRSEERRVGKEWRCRGSSSPKGSTRRTR